MKRTKIRRPSNARKAMMQGRTNVPYTGKQIVADVPEMFFKAGFERVGKTTTTAFSREGKARLYRMKSEKRGWGISFAQMFLHGKNGVHVYKDPSRLQILLQLVAREDDPSAWTIQGIGRTDNRDMRTVNLRLPEQEYNETWVGYYEIEVLSKTTMLLTKVTGGKK